MRRGTGWGSPAAPYTQLPPQIEAEFETTWQAFRAWHGAGAILNGGRGTGDEPARGRKLIVAGTIHLPIQAEIDVATARLRSMELATQMGFSGIEIHAIALAVSEVARNIVHYAGHGEVTLTATAASGCRGLAVVAQDRGPGIPDIERAMKIGFSTGGGLGLGLATARGNMDEFEITSTLGQGTTVRMVKWQRPLWS